MLSVLIETQDAEEPLARTLASLVPSAVEGTVREVIVCDRGSADRTREVADQAGCTFVAGGGIREGIDAARSDWLLFLEPGARLLDGWADHAADHMASRIQAARFSRSAQDRAPFLSRIFSSRRALAEGLLIPKRQAAALARRANEAEALARGLATMRLKAGILIAAPR